MWVVAAVRLSRTQVPSDLTLPDLDPRRYFTAHELSSSASYERFLRIDFLLSQAALLGALGFYAARGARFARESAAGRIGTGMLLAMLGLAIVWLAQLPFSVAALWWERRHHVSHQGYAEAIFGNWLALGAQFLAICVAVLIVMGIAGVLRNHWWVIGGPVFVGIAAALALASPYLLATETHPLRDRALLADARALAREEGVPDTKVEVEDVHEFTTEPNAAAVGLGGGSRVVLWDTLLDGRFPDSEVRVVLAHEFGHIARRHIAKSIGWYALFAIPMAFLIAMATRRRGGMYAPEAVPLALLLLAVLGLLAMPAQNAATRRMEAEADWVALRTTNQPVAMRNLMRRLAVTSRAQPAPPGWAQFLLGSHPTIMERIEMARAFQMRR